MGFDIGGGDDAKRTGGGGVKLMTREEIMRRQEQCTTDGATGEPLVIIPKDSELGEAITARHMHGSCKHFQLDQGQRDCLEQDFWRRMYEDEKYRREWFDNPATYGECQFFEGRLMGFFHPALVMADDLNSSLTGTPAASEKKACPHFSDVGKGGRGMVMGKYVKTSIEH